MVATRIVLLVDVFIVVLSFSASWLAVGSSQSQFPSGYTSFEVASMVGGYVGGQQGYPSNYLQNDYAAYVRTVVPPLIVGSWGLDVAIVLIPLAFVLTILSFSRWQFSLLAGALGATGSLLWIAGISAIAPEAAKRLESWPGFSGAVPQVTLSPSLGPYMALVGGLSLLFTYFLTKAGKLDPPFE
ncbi:MAG: hypothetical protein KGI38_01625 [Thaumarchaeota archaeon]|nr:hypothetical protein [Nitrososphaerota archaeon]